MSVAPIVGTILLAVTAFAATNVDDILILVSFFADHTYRPREVLSGQYLGMVTLIVASLLGALGAALIPRAWLRLLGLVPIAIGAYRLWQQLHDKNGENADPRARPSRTALNRMLSVGIVTIANGGDNIGIYTPLFSVQSPLERTTVVCVFMIMTTIWCSLAHWLVSHKSFGAPIRQYGHRIAPFVLIALGALILHGI